MIWLFRIRWVALGGVLLAAVAAGPLGIRGIDRPILLAAVAGGILYNAYFLRELGRRPAHRPDPLLQVLADFGALTVVLWASGGVKNPFLSLYFVHVLLVTVLGGRRAFLLACTAAMACAAFLLAGEAWPFLRISTIETDPVSSVFLSAAAFAVTVMGSAYVADRAQTELLLRRRQAEEAKRERQRNAEILHSALDRLDVGVEILDPDGSPSFRNRHLLEGQSLRVDCSPSSHGCSLDESQCPVVQARSGETNTCRFSLKDAGGRERVIEMLSFPLSDEVPSAVLRLHIDRTESFLAERRLLFSERLASLGRTVQAVAHELNTPLATIQTLAADMRAALSQAPKGAEALAKDLDESAALILDEMRRCRAITQDLLAGREQLSGITAQGPAEVGGAIRRAATLVFGTGLSKKKLEVDPRVGGLSVSIRNDSLVQVFVNLLQNAADVIDGDPAGKVRIHLAPYAPAGMHRLLLDDNGPGLAPGVRDRLFEAFFTTKPPGKGTGLGLYTAHSLLREVGGGLELTDAPSGGARAILDLPKGNET